MNFSGMVGFCVPVSPATARAVFRNKAFGNVDIDSHPEVFGGSREDCTYLV